MKLYVAFVILLIAHCWASPRKSPLTTIEELYGNKGRIVDGEHAKLGQFPWQVAINLNSVYGSAFCGGSLISNEWILTAGHCVEQATSFDIQLGTIDITSNSGLSLTATEYIRHENYDPLSLNNDLAVIKLPRPIQLNDDIKTVKLACRGSRVGIKEKVTVSGWGKTSDTSTVSNKLNFVELETIGNSVCAIYYGNELILSSTLCAVGHPKNSPCNGDSGGPLVQYDESGDATHIGIVSFVHIDGCASGKPSAYVRTESYLDWIKAKTGLDVDVQCSS